MSDSTDPQPPLQLQFLNITGADMARLQEDNDDTDPRQNAHEYQYPNLLQGSTSPEEGDFDMSSAMGGSNAASPEHGTNQQQQQSRARAKNPLADCRGPAIPEYFANKKTKDGKIPKKRGPKPDSKPARDRRQELNRQAQRNHRLRKEEQTKWLEDSLAQAGHETWQAQQRAMAAERASEHLQRENERLKQLLDVNRIPFEHVMPQMGSADVQQPLANTAQQSQSSASPASLANSPAEEQTTSLGTTAAAHPDPLAIKDHDQAAVEFILALEANCHAHKTFMNARTFQNIPGQAGGHSGMLTRVPIDVAKNFSIGDPPHPHELPNVGEAPGKYARLLGLVPTKPYETTKSWELATGEISPAQAIAYIRKDPRYAALNSEDLVKIADELKDKCRCYGFGAVVEVYEVQDALNDIFDSQGYGVDQGFPLNHYLWASIPLSNPETFNGPMFPALNKLMNMDLAELMSKRETETFQFMKADLQALRSSENTEAVASNDPFANLSPEQDEQLTEDSQNQAFSNLQAMAGDPNSLDDLYNADFEEKLRSARHDY